MNEACVVCGKAFGKTGGSRFKHRPRLYCGSTCRSRAFAARQRGDQPRITVSASDLTRLREAERSLASVNGELVTIVGERNGQITELSARVAELETALRDLAAAEDKYHATFKDARDQESARAFIQADRERDAAWAAARRVLGGDQ